MQIRPVTPEDLDSWRPLWDDYNAFYGRRGSTALPYQLTQLIWQRFFDALEPVHALVATNEERVVGLAHYLFHRSIRRIEPVCYLQDLYTLPSERGKGVGRALIEAVYAQAHQQGVRYVYWQTQADNAAGRLLYDKVGEHAGFIVYGKLLNGSP